MSNGCNAANIGRISYYPESKILMPKMTGGLWEAVTGWLTHAIHASVTSMGMASEDEFTDLGSKTYQQKHKQPLVG